MGMEEAVEELLAIIQVLVQETLPLQLPLKEIMEELQLQETPVQVVEVLQQQELQELIQDLHPHMFKVPVELVQRHVFQEVQS